MNQAIGRVIRHKYDYGAILFFDVRYSTTEVKKEMSGWVRDHIKVWQTFGHGYKEVMEFFKRKREPTNILQLNALLNIKNEEELRLKPLEMATEEHTERRSEGMRSEIKKIESSRESSLLRKINKFDEIIKNNSEDKIQPEAFKKPKGEKDYLQKPDFDIDDPLLELLDLGNDEKRKPEIKAEVNKLSNQDQKMSLIPQSSMESQVSNSVNFIYIFAAFKFNIFRS
jgi:Helicase C-terminal domain